MELERLRLQHAQLATRVDDIREDVRKDLATIHHRINKLELRVLLYALGGGAGGAVLGAAGSAAARTLIGG